MSFIYWFRSLGSFPVFYDVFIAEEFGIGDTLGGLFEHVHKICLFH